VKKARATAASGVAKKSANTAIAHPGPSIAKRHPARRGWEGHAVETSRLTRWDRRPKWLKMTEKWPENDQISGRRVLDILSRPACMDGSKSLRNLTKKFGENVDNAVRQTDNAAAG
jgi:hypothetical protein